MSTARYPEEGQWHHAKLVVRGFDFTLNLGKEEDDLEVVASWREEKQLFHRGGIGFWQDVGSGESAEYRNLRVAALD